LTRIGARGSHQPKSPGDIGVLTAELIHRIDIDPVDPGRHVDSWGAVWRPGRSHHVTTDDENPGGDLHLAQI
jgi:hypothetical protein